MIENAYGVLDHERPERSATGDEEEWVLRMINTGRLLVCYRTMGEAGQADEVLAGMVPAWISRRRTTTPPTSSKRPSSPASIPSTFARKRSKTNGGSRRRASRWLVGCVDRPLPGPRAKTVITSTSPMSLAGCRSRGRRTDRPRGCLLNQLCLVANGDLDQAKLCGSRTHTHEKAHSGPYEV